MMIDDAHSTGVLGRNGRGTVDHFNLHGRVDVQVGTLSKAIGALGGYVCSNRDTIDFLYHRARPFLFSTSHPPSVAATCIAAFEVLEEDPQLIERLWANTRFFKEGLRKLGFDTGLSETPITPIMIGDAALAHQVSRELFQAGVLGLGIGYPTVPVGKAQELEAGKPVVQQNRSESLCCVTRPNANPSLTMGSLTGGERIRIYSESTFGPQSLVGPAVGAAMTEWITGNPPEWGQGLKGY